MKKIRATFNIGLEIIDTYTASMLMLFILASPFFLYYIIFDFSEFLLLSKLFFHYFVEGFLNAGLTKS